MGQKTKNLYLECQPSLLCSETPHQDHNSLLLVGTMVPVDPVSAYGGVRQANLAQETPAMSKPGEAFRFFYGCFIFL